MRPPVLIVGGGFAGLAAAFWLSQKGYPVKLLEKRKVLGGRAYSFKDPHIGEEVDNGPHVLMGCYHETLCFLDEIGATGDLHFQKNLHIDFLSSKSSGGRISLPNAPAPFHLILGLLRTPGLTWRERINVLRIFKRLRSRQSHEGLDAMSAREWLDQLRQSPNLQRRLWNPLISAALNLSPEKASADLFARVLHDSFLNQKEDSCLIWSRVGLSELYVKRVREKICKQGGLIVEGLGLKRLEFEEGRVTQAHFSDGSYEKINQILLTIPYHELLRILPEDLTAHPFFRSLVHLQSSPIVSVHLRWDRVFMDQDFVGLWDSPFHWVFKRGQHLSLIASHAFHLMDLSNEALLKLAVEELQKVFSRAQGAQILKQYVIRETHATLAAYVGVRSHRLPQKTPWENLILAGDWTDTGLPPTIESAVVSARKSVDLILSKHY